MLLFGVILFSFAATRPGNFQNIRKVVGMDTTRVSNTTNDTSIVVVSHKDTTVSSNPKDTSIVVVSHNDSTVTSNPKDTSIVVVTPNDTTVITNPKDTSIVVVNPNDTTVITNPKDTSIVVVTPNDTTVITNPIDTTGFVLSGSAMAGDSLLNSGIAYLYKKGDKVSMKTTQIKGGAFSFSGLPKADFTVYVEPTVSNMYAFIPTYYVNKFLFSNANYLTLDANTRAVIVKLKKVVLPTGTGVISGSVYNGSDSIKNNTKGQFVKSATTQYIVLLYNSKSEPVAWTKTDSQGNYSFTNIPLEQYKVTTETPAAKAEQNITLSVANSNATADLALKTVQGTTLNKELADVVLNVYPNPVVDILNVDLKEAAQISVYNSVGKLIINQNLTIGSNNVDFSNVEQGICFARIGNKTIKVIKK